MARPRILLTGFGPFPGFAENPSAWLVETLGKRKTSPEFELHARVLTTAWEDVARVPRLYARFEPHALIHFGVSRRAPFFYIERSAHNRSARAADARGTMPEGRAIRAGGPQRLDTPFPAAALAAHLRRNGVGARTSRSCGAYLCNFLYYHSLEWAQLQRHAPPVIFVHVPPWIKRRGPCSREALLQGASETLSFVLGYAIGDKPLQSRAGTPMSRSEPGLNAKGA
jgi:pyroglutamyl-peptidase